MADGRNARPFRRVGPGDPGAQGKGKARHRMTTPSRRFALGRALRAQTPRRLAAAGASLLLIMSTVGFVSVANADTVHPDGDTGVAAPNIFIDNSGTAGHHACKTDANDVVGQIEIDYNGNAAHHYTAGESLTVTFVPSDNTITASATPTSVPADWGDTKSFDIAFTTSVPAALSTDIVQTYQVEVTVTGDDSGYAAGSGEGDGKPKFNVVVNCPAPVGVVPAPNVATEVRHASDDSVWDGTSNPFALGDTSYDHASVTATVNIPAGSTITFQLWNGHGCGANGTQIGTDDTSAAFGGASPQTADSSAGDPLHGGDKSYKAIFNSGDTDLLQNGEADCEDFTVNRADTTTVTAIGAYSNGFAVQDSATVDTTGYDGFSLGEVNVTFTLHSTNCSGTVLDTDTTAITGTPPQTVLSDTQTLSPGIYAFEASYPGNGDYNSSTSDCEIFTVFPGLTRGSCDFDLDSSLAGQQFRLIETPDTTNPPYRLTASNPGEFFYNTAVTGKAGDPFAVDITLPYPWVTKGANPAHAYDAVSVSQNSAGYWCAAPSGNGLGADPDTVALGDFSSQTLAGHAHLVVNGTFDSTGFAFIRVKLDFGLKGTGGWTNNAGTAVGSLPAISLINNQLYTFTDNAGGGATTHSLNVFKKDPGIAGLVTNLVTGDPIAGATVKIYDAKSGKLLGTVTTDADGWYLFTFKYSGKTVTFNVVINGITKTITMKSNTFLVANFAY